MLCPELVGRNQEEAILRARLHDLADGAGGVVVLVGDAGVGKSRLVRVGIEEARQHDVTVLDGRAVPGDAPLPYRPLTDAFLGAYRASPPPGDDRLTGLARHLARLVPAWHDETAGGVDDSPVLLGEAAIRLLDITMGPTLLVLEDLHWADAETLAVVDYFADALRTEPVLCLVTTRPEGAAAELLERLHRRDPGAVLTIGPLPDADVEQMVRACLGGSPPGGGLLEFMRTHADGSPFVVEELLAGLVSSGELRQEDGGWLSDARLTPTVPASLQTSIEQRLGTLDPTGRRVLGAAALLGRSFDWDLLPGIAVVDGSTAVEALRAAVDQQLIDVDGDGDGFTFRHALTREAILRHLLPPERRDLASRAWPAHERANPGLPGPTLELAAELATAAGQTAVAVAHLVESARRALAAGALVSAEATARRAVALEAGRGDAVTADLVLLDALLAAGKVAEAVQVGQALADSVPSDDPRRFDLLLTMAKAALAAGDASSASDAVTAAAGAAGPSPAPAVAARLDAAAAAVALDRADLGAAAALARRAVDAAAATGQTDVQCEAILVAGHVVRAETGMESALPRYEEAAAVAAAAGLARLHLQARQECSFVLWTRGDVHSLDDVRRLAVSYGALTTAAAIDLMRADIALFRFDGAGCLEAATACAAASRRYGLASESIAQLWLAGAHALHREPDAMRAAIDAALAPDPDDPRILGDLYGRVLPAAAFVDDELDRLPGLMATMVEHVRRAPPTTSVYPGRILWALLEAADAEDAGAAARAEFAEAVARLDLHAFHLARDLVEAVALGRAGNREAAEARLGPAYEALVASSLGAGLAHTHVLVVARAAHRDGWGDPIRWLRAAEAYFADGGHPLLARRCRTMIGEAGGPVPRRGRGESEVPQRLRALGVTSREVDVLKLVMEGRSNKQIAEVLVLSPKTVERHVSSLFTRLGVRNRRDLAGVGAGHLGDQIA